MTWLAHIISNLDMVEKFSLAASRLSASQQGCGTWTDLWLALDGYTLGLAGFSGLIFIFLFSYP
jgi:hypothetical protein